MDEKSPFALNVLGVQNLIESPTNKVRTSGNISPEGVSGEKMDSLSISASDADLLEMRDEYEKKYAPYEGKLKPRVQKIRESYMGKFPQGQWLVDQEIPIAANLQFEATETFLAAALAKNPQPVVWCDDSEEGQKIADAVTTMLHFHADQLVVRRKLAITVRQWSMDLLGGLKPGWDEEINDVTIDNVKIRDYVFDPDGYVDAYGDFSSWFGERKKCTAERLIELFPEKKTEISREVESQLGTQVTYTEWWPNDEFCFYTFKTIVLDKHKNPYFNYPEPLLGMEGEPIIDEMTSKPKMSEPKNHFAKPKKPGIFLSVYSLQEHPHDITSNVEQNIPNQNRITKRTNQIDFNASTANNSYAYSGDNFTQETAKQASTARARGNPILVPSGGPIDKSVMPLAAQGLPNDIFTELETAKNDLRASWGILGISPQTKDEDQTARGMILRQSQDTSRIGGGIGQAIEQVADNMFNWLVQLYYVFYDEPHFAAIMGDAKAVEYTTISNSQFNKQLIVSIAPDSMIPKDEISQSNMAQALFDKGAIGPITLLKMLSFPDPDNAAADGVFYRVDPAAYMQAHWPELMQQLQAAQMQRAQMQTANKVNEQVATAQAGVAPEATTEPTPGVSQEPASAALSQVPIQA